MDKNAFDFSFNYIIIYENLGKHNYAYISICVPYKLFNISIHIKKKKKSFRSPIFKLPKQELYVVKAPKGELGYIHTYTYTYIYINKN